MIATLLSASSTVADVVRGPVGWATALVALALIAGRETADVASARPPRRPVSWRVTTTVVIVAGFVAVMLRFLTVG